MKLTKPQTEREQQDLEANAFAIALLLPEKPLIEIINQLPGIDISDEDPVIIALAQKLGVTYGLLMFRLGQLWERRQTK